MKKCWFAWIALDIWEASNKAGGILNRLNADDWLMYCIKELVFSTTLMYYFSVNY